MAEIIDITNSYYKELALSKTDMYGNEIPMDLSIYDEAFVCIKRDRFQPDEEAYLIKPVTINETSSTLGIYLSPEETAQLPLTGTDDVDKLQMFVTIGSTGTGETIEVGAYRVKTRYAGLRHYSKPDRSLGDMGCIKDRVVFTYDCGRLCDRAMIVEDLSGGMPIVTDCGYLKEGNYEIVDCGYLVDVADETIDLGQTERRCYLDNCQ